MSKEPKTFARTVWENLSACNVNSHTQKKGKLTYLSWTWALQTLYEEYPESMFEVHEPVRYGDGSVEVRVTVCVKDGEQELTKTMWLPVMDNRNGAIKDPDARQISDAKMRCLVKCISLFGLGLYIFAGEDLPAGEEPAPKAPEEPSEELLRKLEGKLINGSGTGQDAITYLKSAFHVSEATAKRMMAAEELAKSKQAAAQEVAA